MKNVELIKGECAICRGPIDKEWAGENPGLGTVCRTCFSTRDRLFGPENVEIQVKKQLSFDPLLGIYEYNFDWSGTKVMINGQVGTVKATQLGSCNVAFPDDKNQWGTTIKTLDYWRLRDIYGAIGGEIEPPAITFDPYTPKKAELLEKPILEVNVEMDNGDIHSIQVGHKSTSFGRMFSAPEMPNLPTLHAFCNLYVRYKFGLSPNFCAEGGFIGKGFEVRNAGMFTGGVGLTVCTNSGDPLVKTVEEFRYLAVENGLLGSLLENEQDRMIIRFDASAQLVLSTWVTVMETLLRYDWSKFTMDTIGNVWEHYCRIQDVLLNIMPADELTKALAYVEKNKMVHCGSSY